MTEQGFPAPLEYDLELKNNAKDSNVNSYTSNLEKFHEEEDVEVEVDVIYKNNNKTETNDGDPKQQHATGDLTNSTRRRRPLFSTLRENCPYDISYHPGRRILFYAPPRQRQKWGETQVLPRVNWGDLFFDLFYVGATYNVSDILVARPDSLALLYSAATFFAVMLFWFDKTNNDSRFVVLTDDLFHRLFELALLIILAVAVLNIRTVAEMSDPLTGNMFYFCLMLTLERVFTILRYVEIYYKGAGQQPAVRKSAWIWMKGTFTLFVFYLVATILAGIDYFHAQEQQQHQTSSSSSEAGTMSSYTSRHIPIAICLAGNVTSTMIFCIQIIFFFPKAGQHKQISVPHNIDFNIHRYGEWTMLMLGESIFSLLVAYVNHAESSAYRAYYSTFYCSILTVIFLQYLHFQSQPLYADDHAMRRHKNAGVGFYIFFLIYSFALVTFGSSFTFLLVDNFQIETSSGTTTDTPYDPQEIRRRAANMFAGSLAIIFFCLDMMTLLHLGIEQSKERCICAQSKQRNTKGILLVLFRIGLIAFTATLGLWDTESMDLSATGLALVLVQLWTRKLGGKYLSQEHAKEMQGAGAHHDHNHGAGHGTSADEPSGEASWPNVTQARAEPTS